MNYIFKNIASAFSYFRIFPDSEIKLKVVPGNNFEEVNIKVDDEYLQYVLKDGFYPIYFLSDHLGFLKYTNFKGKLDRALNRPSITKFDKNRLILNEKFYKNGVPYFEEDGPSVIYYSSKFPEIIRGKEYFDGKISRIENYYISNNGIRGDIESIVYYKNGKLHNLEDLPSIHFIVNNKGVQKGIKKRTLYKNGILEQTFKY